MLCDAGADADVTEQVGGRHLRLPLPQRDAGAQPQREPIREPLGVSILESAHID
eukprot:COSAG04_NODE_13421_length_607_cov_0.568898_1_plen_54_part_00